MINEFGFSDRAPTGWNLEQLALSLKKNFPEMEYRIFTGFIRNYQAGGLSVLRILNLILIYLLTPFVIFWNRPTHCLVMTSPPGIQIWTLFISKMLNIRTSMWAMDLHPELEVKILEANKSFSFLVKALRKIDAWSMKNFEFIIVLDRAMEQLIKGKAANQDVIVYPTMLEQKAADSKSIVNHSKEMDCVKFVYAGNFGVAHEINRFEEVVKWMLSNSLSLELISVGTSVRGEKVFEELSKYYKFSYQKKDRQKPSELASIFSKCHFGLVLMRQSYQGIVSPSKFLDYLNNQLPVFYCGPEDTNAYDACQKFNAGIWASDRNSEWKNQLTAAVQIKEVYEKLMTCTQRAMEHYQSKNSEGLAQEIMKRWKLDQPKANKSVIK